jgi:hypothetical protein
MRTQIMKKRNKLIVKKEKIAYLEHENKNLKKVIEFQRKKIGKMYEDTMKSFDKILKEIDGIAKNK